MAQNHWTDAEPPTDVDLFFEEFGTALLYIRYVEQCWSKGPKGIHRYVRFRCPLCAYSIQLYRWQGHGYLRFPRPWPGIPFGTHAPDCVRNGGALRHPELARAALRPVALREVLLHDDYIGH